MSVLYIFFSLWPFVAFVVLGIVHRLRSCFEKHNNALSLDRTIDELLTVYYNLQHVW